MVLAKENQERERLLLKIITKFGYFLIEKITDIKPQDTGDLDDNKKLQTI